jgi:hypothetical protein
MQTTGTEQDVEAHRAYSDEKLKQAVTKLEDALAQLRGIQATPEEARR